jgi:[ribosomal protein S5]-alanine N-acetyltransferase
MHEPLVTERLRLRPFRIGDLRALHAMWADPEVGRWVGGTHTRMQQSREELGQHMEHQARHGFAFWAVEERETGGLVGEVGLMFLEGQGPDVEIGWCLGRPAWGRGYATEAAEAWLQAGFDRLGLDRIIAAVLEDNARSRRVCEKLGMRPDGTREVYGAEHLIYVRER